MNEKHVTLSIDLTGVPCPSRHGLTAEEETKYNPALGSYIVNGRCDALGIEGFSRPSQTHGLGNENNIQWCSSTQDKCQGKVTVEKSLCASGEAELAFVKQGSMHECNFRHYAQYICRGENPQACPSVTSTTTTTTPLTDVTWLDLSGKVAKQSSTDWEGHAQRAIDGNKATWWGSGSCTHTATEANPWWEVDLGNTQNIRAVKVTNRNQFGDRLNPFSIRIDGKLCASHNIVADGKTKQIACVGIGQRIRVEVYKVTALTICEFQVAAGQGTTTVTT